MCPRNCGPVTRQLRRVGSLCICHNPLRVETSSVARRSRALLVDFILPLLVFFVPVADCKSYAFAARSTRAGASVRSKVEYAYWNAFPLQYFIAQQNVLRASATRRIHDDQGWRPASRREPERVHRSRNRGLHARTE